MPQKVTKKKGNQNLLDAVVSNKFVSDPITIHYHATKSLAYSLRADRNHIKNLPHLKLHKFKSLMFEARTHKTLPNNVNNMKIAHQKVLATTTPIGDIKQKKGDQKHVSMAGLYPSMTRTP
jgi:hypothetical protein